MSDTLDIIINDARWAAENPILALKRKPAPGALHVLTVGEVVPVRLFFYDGPEGAAALSSVRKNGVTIGLFGKLVRKDGETFLFGTTVFTEAQDPRGDYYYAGSLDLLTDELKNALNQGFDGSAFVDIRINGVRTHQFKLPIRPRTYAGTELDTHPAAEGLLEEMQAAAAEADADAAAANAAKVAAEGFRDEAQGFRNEAEGFKNESEAARDASQGFRNEAEGFKNDAEAARDAAATSEGNAATSESNAAASAADAEAQRLAIIAAAFRTDIDQTFTLAEILKGQANAGFLGKLGVNLIGGSAAGNGYGYASSLPIPGDFALVLDVTPRWSDASFTSLADLAGASLALGYTTSSLSNPARLLLDNTASAFGWNTGFTCAQLVGKRCVFVVTRTGSTMTATMNGVALTQVGTLTAPGTTTINRIGGGIVGGYGQFQGDIHDVRLINRPLTTGEEKSIALGVVPAVLASRGGPGSGGGNMTTSPNDIGGAASSASTTGVTFTQTGGAGTNTTYFHSPSAGIRVKAGQTVTWLFDVATSGYSGVDVSAAAFDDVTGFITAVSASLVSGSTYAATWVATRDVYGVPAMLSARISGTAASSSSTITVSNYHATIIGTTAHFPGNKVTANAWCDDFGTVLRPGFGITPLAPVPSVSYVITGTVAGATVTAGTVASIGAFTPTGGLSATALASAAQWDVVSGMWAQSRPANAGPLNAQITSAGTLTFECAAHTSNAVVSANTAVKATITIN